MAAVDFIDGFEQDAREAIDAYVHVLLGSDPGCGSGHEAAHQDAMGFAETAYLVPARTLQGDCKCEHEPGEGDGMSRCARGQLDWARGRRQDLAQQFAVRLHIDEVCV